MSDFKSIFFMHIVGLTDCFFSRAHSPCKLSDLISTRISSTRRALFR